MARILSSFHCFSSSPPTCCLSSSILSLPFLFPSSPTPLPSKELYVKRLHHILTSLVVHMHLKVKEMCYQVSDQGTGRSFIHRSSSAGGRQATNLQDFLYLVRTLLSPVIGICKASLKGKVVYLVWVNCCVTCDGQQQG